MVRRYSTAAALTLVREFLTRDERDSQLCSRRYPIIVFTGPREIGKTALLDELTAQMERWVPYARIDCADFSGGAQELLTLLAFDLNRGSGEYGTLPFPRFITGQLAIAAQLDRVDRNLARSQVGQVLEDHKQTRQLLQAAFTELINRVIQALGGVPAVEQAGPVGVAAEDMAAQFGPRLILGGLAATRWGRRLILGRGQEWWGHQDRGLNRSPLDVLVDLNQMAASPKTGTNQQDLAEWLWAAFLADLRDSFQNSRRASRRTLNCVVMLDNVDGTAGEDFLAELVEARRNRIAFAPGEPDPLTVVATSRGGLAEGVCGQAGIVPLAEAGYAGYLQRSGTPIGRDWYPVRLPDLTENEVSNMVAALELPGGSRGLVSSAVYRFTSGHPGSVRILLDEIAEHPDHPADLLAILGNKETGPAGTNDRLVEESLRAHLLAGVPDGDRDDLETCAAARNKETALHLAEESGLLTGMRGEDSVIFAPELWRVDADSGSAVLYPALSRLLSRRLARRVDQHLASWDKVHGWLRDRCQEAGDEDGELYHALAMGDLEYVACELTRQLKSTEADQWLRLLDAVTIAPNRLDHQQAINAQIAALTTWAQQRPELFIHVGRLVAAAWIDADPLSDQHHRSLLREQADDLERIAPDSKGIAVLRERAQEYAPKRTVFR